MTRLWIFALVALGQLAVPTYMIREAERTLADGEVMRFRTAPVDPQDLFRGRYVRLDFEALRAKMTGEEFFQRNRAAHVLFERDAEGFARAIAIQEVPPDSVNFMTVHMLNFDSETNEIEFELPVDRFYMEESLAPLAEREYARLRGRSAWAELRVRYGHTLIEQVFIDGVPLARLAREVRE